MKFQVVLYGRTRVTRLRAFDIRRLASSPKFTVHGATRINARLEACQALLMGEDDITCREIIARDGTTELPAAYRAPMIAKLRKSCKKWMRFQVAHSNLGSLPTKLKALRALG